MSKIQERIKLHLDVAQEELNKCDWKFEKLTDKEFVILCEALGKAEIFFAHMNDEDKDYFQFADEAVDEYLNPPKED